jgi:hypothetical protein
MMQKIWLAVKGNYMIIMFTFELFWIVVFLLDKLGSGSGGGVPRFVYVNF